MSGRLLRTLAVAVAALAVGLGASTHAHAAPTPAELEKQIDEQWQLLEPIIEAYNGVNGELKANRVKAEALQRDLLPLQIQVDMAMTQVTAMAVQAYKGGRVAAVNALLVGSPSGLADQLARLDVLARRQRAQVADVAAVRDRYAADQKALDGLIGEQAQHEAQLAAKKREIEARIAELERLRRAASGGSTSGNTGNLKPTSCPAEAGGNATAAQAACGKIGKMYLFGAEGPDRFDCSGLTLYAWAQAGRSLSHNSKAQYTSTRRISRSELRPGDLVFYYSDIHHVGLYVGSGYMVHASRAGEPVAMVAIERGGMSPMGYGRVG